MQIELSELSLLAVRLVLAVIDQGAIDNTGQGQAVQINFPNFPRILDETGEAHFVLKVEGSLGRGAPITGAIHFRKKEAGGKWSEGEVAAFLKLGISRYVARLECHKGQLCVMVSRDRATGGEGEVVSAMQLRQVSPRS